MIQGSPAIPSNFFAVGSDIKNLLHLLLKAPVGLAIYSGPSFVLQFVNDNTLDVWGKKREEVLDKPLFEIFPELLGSKLEQIIRNVYSTAEAFKGKEHKVDFVRDEKFVTRYFNFVFEPIPDAKGLVTGFIAITTDVTEELINRKKIEDAEKKLQHFFRHAPVGIVIYHGPDFIVDLVNDRVLEMWGKKWDDVKGKAMKDIFPEIDSGEYIRNLYNASVAKFKVGETYTVNEVELTFNRNGQLYTGWYSYTHEPIKDLNGNVTGIIAVANEVTEQVIARKKIEESEERFRSLANQAPLFVWLTDENLKTTYINKAGLNYFGLDESTDVSTLSWKRFIHPGDLEKVLAIMTDAAKKNVPYTLEMRLKNGTTQQYRWFLDKGMPQYINEKFIGFIGTSLDIEDRKEAEKTLENMVKERTAELDGQNKLLKKQNDLIKKIIDSTLDSIAVYDAEMRIISINQSALNLFGNSEEDVIGKKLTEAFPQFVNTKSHDDLQRALKGETIHTDIYQSSVTGRYYENFLVPLRADDNKIYAVLAIAHDNTNLINKNRELIEAQQIAQLGSWEWNTNSNEVSWSDQMYNIYGYTDERVPMNFDKALERMSPEEARETREKMNGYMAEALRMFGEKGQTIFDNPSNEYQIFLPDSSKKILRGNGKIIFSEDGRVSRVIGTVQDITEQKKSQEKIIEANEKLEQRNQFVEKLINSSLDLIVVVDKELKFITINKKAESVIKSYYSGELSGKNIVEVTPSFRDSESYQDLLRAFEGEIIIRDKVKSTISQNYYEHNYVPLQNASGNVYAVMIISHDITENIQQLEELKKLNESDKLKSDFIKMASHELKTPITSIKGYVQLLLAVLNREEDEKAMPPLLVKSSLISIDKQITRLTRLMSELLDLSKIESGMLELNKELFSINETVIETVQDILYTNSKQSINIFHNYSCNVYGDKDRIGQVLINFLTNAIKYSPNSDRIEIEIRHTARNYVSVSVKDYGIGIDEKDQEKIFERFYRAQGKEEQTFPGFGIGLFIAKEIIQRHNGTIHFMSEKGKGSVFTFTLPIAHDQKMSK